ncbi:ABC transporter ATP-binding protein [Zafaria cholistanensis]|uniref:ABC transporter ATP-binding protein n=1 Tax=Zafaria cholistanensis TaxID=1682741 RepID=A0A5A7NLG7_9MICC|nr:ABC transporter ATP-binding protein [Zafaria cholistanensis]GER21784.1 ABC transporter ATP-binding protein [Zafaria cholistanensis]
MSSAEGPDTRTALRFEGVDVFFDAEFSEVHAVKGFSLEVKRGEVVALVGESGSGKSAIATAAMGLLPANARVAGRIQVGGTDVLGLDEARLRRMRASNIAMVFQEPMTALNPVLTVGDQLTEALELHGIAHGKAADRRAAELLGMVGIPDPHQRLRQYPHQFSGGQRQRIVIAMAISCGPRVIIADEPTTALDVTVQAEILDLLRELKDKLDTGILLITHNMGVVADLADRVAVMFQGRVVEAGTVRDVLTRPEHAYTRTLLAAVPHLGRSGPQAAALPAGGGVAGRDAAGGDAAAGETVRQPVLRARGLAVEYTARGRAFRAVEDISFEVAAGEILGLVGESGSGKSTIAKVVLGLLPVASGELMVHGQNLAALKGRSARAARARIGAVFQDPAASLNPRFPIGECIVEPMVVHGKGNRRSRAERAYDLLDAVRLPRSVVNRYPHELSGGQRQRVSIARALALDPELLVADEPTSALDVSVQAAVLEMFAELQSRYEFACLFVSHDLAVVDMLAHSVLVMRNGRTVEQGPAARVLHEPRQDYTRRLLAAAPVPEPGEQRRRREARRALLAEQPAP